MNHELSKIMQVQTSQIWQFSLNLPVQLGHHEPYTFKSNT